jgi:hypothetical protein
MQGGWGMFTHPIGGSHADYDFTFHIDVRDARGAVHAYQIPPATHTTFWQKYVHFYQTEMKRDIAGSPEVLENIALWHARQVATVSPDSRPPFTTTCYTRWRLINPPGSPSPFSPTQVTVIRTYVFTAEDLEKKAAWKSYDDY